MKVVADAPEAFVCASGSWTVWSLSDGHLDLPASSLIDPAPERQSPVSPADDPVRPSVNSFLFQRSGQEQILVDYGAGGAWDDSWGISFVRSTEQYQPGRGPRPGIHSRARRAHQWPTHS